MRIGSFVSVLGWSLVVCAWPACSENGSARETKASTALSSDASLAAATGTPSIDGLGALGGGAHGAKDHVELSSLVPRAYLLARLLMEIGRTP